MLATSPNITEPMRTITTVCRICGLKGSVEIVDNEFTTMFQDGFQILCDSCAEKERQDRIEKDRIQHKNDVLRSTHIPPEFTEWDKSLGNRDLAMQILNNNTKHLYVWGDNGTCKTRAMAYNLYMLANKGTYCQFWRFGELALKFAQSMKSESTTSEDFLNHLLSNDIVMIDDVCKRKPTTTAAEFLYLLLDKVYSGEFSTKLWMTFNRSNNELAEYFEENEMADAIVSRIDRLADTGDLKIIRS